jgi:hypothetical protein
MPTSCLRHAGFQLDFSTLKMEATCSSEASIDFQRSTRRYIQKDRTMYLRKILDQKSIESID